MGDDSGAVAGGGEVYAGADHTMQTGTRRGGGGESEEKPMKPVARAIAGMAGGAGEFSYTRNSAIQSQSVTILQPILEQEIQELQLLKDWNGSAIRLADFGCSVGANTLRYAEICYRNVCRARMGRNGIGRKIPDEVQYFFCDLPSNDFNTLFLQLEDWKKTQTAASMEDFYATAIAGSFYGRLLPRGSLHVAISAFAVHWMSQVPSVGSLQFIPVPFS